MARVQNVGSGARRPRAARRHIGHDRHRRGKDRLDDVAHGSVETARRIHLKDDDGAVLVRRIRERALDIAAHCGADGTVEFDQGCEPVNGRGCIGLATRHGTRKQQADRKPLRDAAKSIPPARTSLTA